MLMRRQDLSVLFLYFLGFSRIRNRVLRFKHMPVTRVLTFHDILPEWLDSFTAKLRFLKRNTNVVSLEAFFSGKLSFEKINTVITFDDGYKGWMDSAVPVLREMDLPATFFVSSGFVGLSNKDAELFLESNLFSKLGTRRISGCLAREDLPRLSEKGFTVGGHTLNHSNLVELRDRGKIQREILEDKKWLEELTGKKVKYFSYPGGDFKNPVIDITDVLRDAGYAGAVTTVPGFNYIYTNPYLLNRELTGAQMPEWIFRARVYGNYDAVRYLQKRVRMVFHRR